MTLPAPTPNGPPAHAALPRLTILIADDDEDMRFYLKGCLRHLKPRPKHVLEAADGAEALRLVGAGPVHLIICDVVMPGLDGYALCRALKTEARTRAIPVLLISGETRAPPLDCADGFLAKPFNATQFRAEVERLLREAT